MQIDFSGQVVIVTGATRGIGKQIADDFEKLGAILILTGTRKNQIDKLNQVYETSPKNKRRYYCVDFSDAGSTDKFLREIKKYKRIDVCVNNAGINRINYIQDTELKDWDDIMSVNLRAPYLIISKLSGIMKRHRYGRIVNISSIFGTISKEKRSIYSMSKFGLRGLTIAASNELARYNVLVNAVSPGFVLTELTKRILAKSEIQDLKKQIPAYRLATPKDISSAVIFLSSNLNTYITGQDIIVDGGYINV